MMSIDRHLFRVHRSAIAIGLLLFSWLWGLALWLLPLSPPITTTSIALPLSAQQTLIGKALFPTHGTAPFPAILLCHGVNSSKNTLTPLAQELARRGIASVVFDFGGYGQSYSRPSSQAANLRDVQIVLHWMRHHPQIDRDRLGILGHSMGGTTALETAIANPDLKTTILLSIGGNATPQKPANLLVASGIYEELNPVGEMQELFAPAVDRPADRSVIPGEIFGNFSKGTARQLFFSSTADHAIAPFDPQIHQAVLAWAAQSFQLPQRDLPLRSQQQMIGMIINLGSTFLILFKIYHQLLQKYDRFLISIIGAGIVSILLLKNDWSSGITMISSLVLLMGNYHYFHRQSKNFKLKKLFLYLTIAFLLFVTAVMVNALVTGSLSHFPQAIWSLPILTKNLMVGLTYDRFHLWRYALESIPGILGLSLLLGLEIWSPGITLRYLSAIARWTLSKIRQPIAFQMQSSSRLPLLLLPLLLAVLLALLWQQLQSGLLTWDSAQFAIRLIVVFILLPGLLGIALLRYWR
ncbi:MAG: alpha/beta fold hydrolase [Synechococcales bacterium]|nr:alpha/beta fold hydrolase [Synechococcales bacterium]